ncbi:MAG TPA: glycosyltransferase family 2 protein [Acidimicrobiia bacterium]|nr:glycosyltransferase family 2 protein [Acidimicrobiia bacterium]
MHTIRDASAVRVSIVVPCYGSGDWIDELVRRVGEAMADTDGGFELILVNDATPDAETWPAIRKQAEGVAWVRAVDLLGNVGQFRALMCGLELARGEIVVTMDDDLQHPPEEVPRLVSSLEADPSLDAVIGSYASKEHSSVRNVGTRVVSSIYARSYGKPAGLQTTSFRAMRRPLVDAILANGTVRPVMGALILQSTKRVVNIPVEHHPRQRGRSGWRPGRLVGTVVDNVVNASTAPLRLVSMLGLLTWVIALGLAIYYLIRALTGELVPGFATLALLVLFFGGTNLLAIGVLGEYAARIVTEVTDPPRWVVREQVE